MPREVPIGSAAGWDVVVGGVRIPVAAGLAGGGDLIRIDLAAGDDRTGRGLAGVRHLVTRPLLVDVHDAHQAAAAAPYADGVVARAALLESADVLTAVRREVPVIVRRDPETELDDWLAAAQRCLSHGHEVILCEGGDAPAESDAGRKASPRLELVASLREHTDLPVVIDVSAAPDLTAAAVAAGAHGLVLRDDASAAEAARAVELATTMAPFGRALQPHTIEAARQAIDQVDACLADLLERRAALAGLVQRLKPVGGFAGRDHDRERDLIAAMARRAPRLGLERVRRIMAVVIEAGLDLAESDPYGRNDEGSESHPAETAAGRAPIGVSRTGTSPRQARVADAGSTSPQGAARPPSPGFLP